MIRRRFVKKRSCPAELVESTAIRQKTSNETILDQIDKSSCVERNNNDGSDLVVAGACIDVSVLEMKGKGSSSASLPHIDMPKEVAMSKPLQPPQGVIARLDWRKKDAHRRKELDLMKQLRRIRDAPVDKLFTPAIADAAAPAAVKDFHVFVAVFLSSQTRDEVTASAMFRLKEKLPGGLSISSVSKARIITLAKLIKPVAFHNTKAKNIKLIAGLISKRYAGAIPLDADLLCELPGIGPKMAHIVVSTITGKPQGIGIDVHVHRITNKLGWVKTKEPEQTRTQLQNMLPYSEWADVNIVMVGLGQQMNSARSTVLHRCFDTSCPVAALSLLRRLGVDVGSRDKKTGEGLLHWAAADGHAEVLSMLLKYIEPWKDNDGRWPWNVAASSVVHVFDKWRRRKGIV